LTQPIIVTYSSLAKFKNCPRAYKYRCVDEIIPIRFESEPLTFGRFVHFALETWFKTRDKAGTLALIRAALANSEWGIADPRSLQIIAMITGYMNHYPEDSQWTVEAVEEVFNAQWNDRYMIMGKVDGIIHTGNLRYILEHKTAQRVNYGYLAGLQGDFQSLTYAHFYPKFSGKPVHGVCYDILQKTGIRLKKNETEEEFIDRLNSIFSSNGDMFHREYLHFSADEFRDYKGELEKTLELLDQAYEEYENGNPHAFPKNTQFCFSWGRPCPYFQLCRSLDNPGIKENFYKHEPAHSELNEPEEIPF